MRCDEHEELCAEHGFEKAPVIKIYTVIERGLCVTLFSIVSFDIEREC